MIKKLKILLLEDVQEDAGLIRRLLMKEGFDFESQVVDSRDEFVLALKEFHPDVVLSDHSLPQFNSVEALTITRKQAPHLPFILVTGTVSEEFAVNSLKQGADDYVLKSNLTRLPAAITNSLRHHTMEIKRKKAEKALRKQNEELVKINKELDSFVYSVSHNLRAPLMSVLGLLNLIKLEGQHDERAFHNYYMMMQQSVHKLDDTLKEILDYSRNARTIINVAKVNLRAIVEDGFERLKYIDGSDTIEKKISITDDVELYSDSIRLSVIFNNLISNAIKYRDSGKPKSFIEIRITVTADNCSIIFKDNGIGIAEELEEKIFDMFFRATERSDGAGLGLYIVKETVEKLNGTVSVESIFREGTSFMIDIPNRYQAGL